MLFRPEVLDDELDKDRDIVEATVHRAASLSSAEYMGLRDQVRIDLIGAYHRPMLTHLGNRLDLDGELYV